MPKYYLTNKAVEDLSNIWNYTCENWSEKLADKYYASLLHCCEKLAEKPKAGRKYHEVTLSLLGCKVNQHIIFYRLVADKEIEVVRILHSKMDLKSRIHE